MDRSRNKSERERVKEMKWNKELKMVNNGGLYGYRTQLKMKCSRPKRTKNAGKRDEINESYLINKFTGNEWKRTNEVGAQFLLARTKKKDAQTYRIIW